MKWVGCTAKNNVFAVLKDKADWKLFKQIVVKNLSNVKCSFCLQRI